jgi:hypothetical protein
MEVKASWGAAGLVVENIWRLDLVTFLKFYMQFLWNFLSIISVFATSLSYVFLSYIKDCSASKQLAEFYKVFVMYSQERGSNITYEEMFLKSLVL